jgi:CRP-like cAMP-binding protein
MYGRGHTDWLASLFRRNGPGPPAPHEKGRGIAPLLAALPPDEHERLRPLLKRVHLDTLQVLYRPGERITRVYFPITSVLSVLVLMGDGVEIEAGIVGNEGLLGMPLFHGTAESPHRAVCQVAGEAWQVPADAFREALGQNPGLPALLGRYAQALFVQVAQAAGCNRVHSIEQRCARWLLMVHDRVGQDQLFLTQELLAGMLGVRRATVSQVMADLRRRGLVRYTRGHVTILDRARLEATACVCYRIVTDEAERLLGSGGSARRSRSRAP